jgi:hypothetical protein
LRRISTLERKQIEEEEKIVQDKLEQEPKNVTKVGPLPVKVAPNAMAAERGELPPGNTDSRIES